MKIYMFIVKRVKRYFRDIKRTFIVVTIIPTLSILIAAGSMLYSGIQTSLLQQQISESKDVTSAEFIDTISQRLNDSQYDSITTAIEGDNDSHSSSFPVWTQDGGQFDYNAVTKYISIFDEVGNLYKENLVNQGMAYTEFSYDAEKAWCNNSIQDLVLSDRQADGSYKYNGERKDWYGFEQLATTSLKIDHQTCTNLNSY